MPAILAYGTVIDLTDRRIRTVTRQVKGANIEALLHRFLSSVHSGLFSKVINFMASGFTDDAIWFRGVSQKLWDENVDMRSVSKDLIPRLEKIKDSVLIIRRKALEDLPKTTNKSLQEAQSRLIVSTAELFESIEDFKWTIKELEANYGTRVRKLHADTPEALDELFQVIQDAS